MPKTFKTLKRYYSQIQVKKGLIILQFLALLIPAILSILTPVFSAKLITALTVFDYAGAKHFLWINFIIILASTALYLAYNIVSIFVRKQMTRNLHEYLYQNVRANKNLSSISLSVLSGIDKLIAFNHELLYKICFFIKSVVLLSIIFYYNYLIAIILLGVSITTYIFLNLSDSKIKQNSKLYGNNQNKTLELFNSIKNGSDEEQGCNVEIALKDNYYSLVEGNIKTTNQITGLYFLNNNIISLILKSTVFGLTIYLINLVMSTELTLPVYLVLTPYLTSSAQNLIEFFEIFAEIGEVDNTLLELDALKFQSPAAAQNHSLTFDTFNLTFYRTNLEQKTEIKIKNLNFQIPFHSNALFVGAHDSGIEQIFNMLQRKLKPTSGSIFIDDKNIFDIQSETYSKLISFAKEDSKFFDVSIFENLHIVCENRTKIYNGIKAFGLTDEINRLPRKINSTVPVKTNKNLLYFLSILRSYLSGSQIIAIFGYPENFTLSDHEKLKKIIRYISKTKSLLLFSKSDDFASLFKKTLYISSGTIQKIV